MYEKRISMFDYDENKVIQKEEFSNPLKQIPYLENAIPCLQENFLKSSQKELQSLYFSLEDAIFDDNSHHKSGYLDQFRTQNQYYTVDDIFCMLEQSYQCKILIQGQAGAGKTTLIQYIAHQWSQKNILSDRFSEIYFISLKTLLNQTWAEQYIIDQKYSKEFQINPLKFLIHTNVSLMINNQGQQKQIQPEDIKLYNDKILLLIDGFNEITSVQEDHIVCLILKQIFDQQNIILTSRTNTLSIYWKNKFDIILENIGFNKLQIHQYIENHIDQQILQAQLYKIIIENKQLYKISQIPANLAMLCQIVSLIKDNLQSLKIDGLYQLYRLFFQMLFEKLDQCLKNQSQNEQKLSQIDLIRQLAYSCQTEQILEIESQIDKDDAITINHNENEQNESYLIKNLDQFVNFGLIKQVFYDKKVYRFTHLLFQEFLAAEYLVEKLQSGNKQKKKNVISYISQHRNEERMRQVLKFMSQIIINLGNQSILDEFWYSMSCNIEGMLEFDIIQKVKLLMQLIGNINNSSENEIRIIDSTIPNINQIKIFIDLIVLFNLNEFKYELMHSGYKSQIISSKIQSLLEGFDNTSDLLREIKIQIINYNFAIDVDSVERYYNSQKDIQCCINFNQKSQSKKDQKIQNQNDQQEEQFKCIQQVDQFLKVNQSHEAQNDKFVQEMINKSLGLNMANFYSYIDQNILEQSILDILNKKETETYTKSIALKIIIKQLQNQFDFNNKYYQKIFDWIIETEISYQSNLQKITKSKRNSDEFKNTQDRNVESEDMNQQADCFYCQNYELIMRQNEEVLHEQMILILKYLNSFNLSSFYQCLNSMTKYLLHYQKNLLPLAFEIIIQARQLNSQNYIHIKQGQATLHELVKIVANHVLDFPNFLQIWRTFTDEMKNILLDNLECICKQLNPQRLVNLQVLQIKLPNNQNTIPNGTTDKYF
ncbi:NACHT domain protein (macronuclear) [Tetrahymena thermophila SB210]|uniref:NACHT domain protein n=1 Tax=Tetrahymena thermophila (strain SB210) TaxID=312017 RepID=Q24G77_TETTS|nr:NACHT domain protein [Tetrahymena thermophila SB210]EAS06776.2 NACHT domain protein [Tetrahymena thermophila SB210]|eukprot:XP_001027018.2 NACHT domain protein [Tetrahymena thermophila SB210]